MLLRFLVATVFLLGQIAELRAEVMDWGAKNRPVFTRDFVGQPNPSPVVVNGYSRTSNATLFDQTGQLTYAGNNIVIRSQDISNAAWGKIRSSIGATTTAPDGTPTALALVEDASNNTHYILQSPTITTGGKYIFSVYAKPNGRDWISLSAAAGSNFVYVNVATGAIGTVGGGTTLGNISVQPAGNGFYRVSMAFTAAGGSSAVVYTASADNTNSYAGDGTSGLYIWGIQLEQVTYQTTPSSYQATTSAAYYESPRTLYVNGVASGNLLEGAATNLITQSQTLNTTWVTTGITSRSLSTTSPDGSSLWTLVTENTAASAHAVYGLGFSTTASTAYTASVYVKAGTQRYISLRGEIYAAGPLYPWITFDTQTGAINANAGVTSSGSTSLGGGVYRIWLTFTVSSSLAGTGNIVISGSDVATAPATNSATGNSYTGTSQTWYAWGAQLETGTTATSLIPTFGAALTRNADTPSSVTSPLGPNLTFSRASNATVFDATGALTYAPNNTALHSNTFSNAAWQKLATGTASVPVVTDNYAAAPDGSQTAARLQMTLNGGTTAADLARLTQSPAAITGAQTINSIYVKSNTGVSQEVRFLSPTGAGTNFTVTTSWTRISLRAAAAGATSPVELRIRGDLNASPIDILIAWAQCESVTYETDPRTYNPTTSAAYYGPRFDNTPATANSPLGLLIEESRTNVALYSRDMTNAAWTKTNITAALNQIGIDGAANSASAITATAGNGTVLQAVVLASSQRFQTAYVKRLVGTGVVNMTTDNGATWTAITVTGAWTRVSIPAQTLANPTFGFQIVTNGDSIAVDCVQNETGAFATSAIPTYGSALTRAADVVTFAGNALSTLVSSSGTVITQANIPTVTGGSDKMLVRIGAGSNTDDIASFVRQSDGLGMVRVDAGSVNQVFTGLNTWSSGVTNRQSIRWTRSNASVVVGSGSVTGSAIGTFPTLASNAWLGGASTNQYLNGWVQGVSIYNTPLNDNALRTKVVVGSPY
jgi:hypothetical protein